MGWQPGKGNGAGEEPLPEPGAPGGAGASGAGVVPGGLASPGGAVRDERLAGFARGGEWDSCPPGPELAAVLAEVAGGEWRCPGATSDELTGVMRRAAALESYAAAAKLGVIRELIRRDGSPLPGQPGHGGGRPEHGDLPDTWSDSVSHEVALTLACSVASAEKTALAAWELGARLPGIAALLEDGTLTYAKARLIAETFALLSDADAARAEALIIPYLAGTTGKTFGQIAALAARIGAQVDPGLTERRRKGAVRHASRVEMFREQSGAAALSGRELPPDEVLAADANVTARAVEYKDSGVFPGARMDQLRSTAYLDLINGRTAEARIALGYLSTDPRPGDEADPGDGGLYSGGPRDGGPSGGDAPRDGGPSDGGPDSDGPGMDGCDPGIEGHGDSDPGHGCGVVDGRPAGTAPPCGNNPSCGGPGGSGFGDSGLDDTAPDNGGPSGRGAPGNSGSSGDSGPGNDDGPGDGRPDDAAPPSWDAPGSVWAVNGGPDSGEPSVGNAPGGRGADGPIPPAFGGKPGGRPVLADLVVPLATLLGLAERPGEAHRLGVLDPGLCRDLAALAAASPHTQLCLTVTDSNGIAIGHGCARPGKPRPGKLKSSAPPGPLRAGAQPPPVALPARVNLTITAGRLSSMLPGSSVLPEGAGQKTTGWALARAGRAGPGQGRDARTRGTGSPPCDLDAPGDPEWCGTWALTLPNGLELVVSIVPVPTRECDHRYESRGYQPNDTLRHLVQVRDHVCTFPSCSRHARESDYEHARPYDKGGRTCACNTGARSRKCHRIKQSPGWNVTQPKPGWHVWTTPSGRTYTQLPYQYPV